MIRKLKKSGMSLVEVIVVVAVVALLVGLSVPAYRAFDNAINAPTGVESMISAALSSARGLAAKHQTYAGIRFQQDADGNQYMVMVIHDYENTGLANGFRAASGISPVKLPESVVVLSTQYRTSNSDASNPSVADITNSLDYGSNSSDISDISTFAVLFSPAGNLVKHEVRVRNKNGKTDDTSEDSIFNTKTNVLSSTDPLGRFIQDDYAGDGYGAEIGASNFMIISKKDFFESSDPWTDFIEDPTINNKIDNSKVLYINPYTGAIIKNE